MVTKLNLVKWLADFTTKRKIRIKLGKTCSAIRHIKQGVPKGSALGPILWNFAIEDKRQELADELNNSTIRSVFQLSIFLVEYLANGSEVGHMIYIYVFLVASSIGIDEKKLHARVTRKVCISF